MRHIIIGGDGFVGAPPCPRASRERASGLLSRISARAQTRFTKRYRSVRVDITDPATFDALEISGHDVIHNMAARMLSPILPRKQRRAFFWPVNTDGVAHLLEHMERKGASRLVHFTTDMVYGHSKAIPQTEDHPVEPLGPYGESKRVTEDMCREYRAKAMKNIRVSSPPYHRTGAGSESWRSCSGWSMRAWPVPMIGSGRNPYQFVSVYDCASAAICAWKAGFPNSEYNIGSAEPPPVRELLGRLVREAGSRSLLLPTPAWAVKTALNTLDFLNMPLMDPEQYLIADEYCVLDCSRAKREIGWGAPLSR